MHQSCILYPFMHQRIMHSSIASNFQRICKSTQSSEGLEIELCFAERRGNEVRGIFSWPIKIFISYRLGNNPIFLPLLIFPSSPQNPLRENLSNPSSQVAVPGRVCLVKLRRTFVFCVSLLFVKKIYV